MNQQMQGLSPGLHPRKSHCLIAKASYLTNDLSSPGNQVLSPSKSKNDSSSYFPHSVSYHQHIPPIPLDTPASQLKEMDMIYRS